MFIPKGKAIHENLATSYVLVDALVDDLCEGGFSGIVEIALRDSDAQIIIERGKVMAAIERAAGKGRSRTTIAQLAARARRERGSISFYAYESGVALALAERAGAQSLYTGLSTDFVDLDKMISKLSRERDRHWFIEISTEGGVSALIDVRDDLCNVVMSEAGRVRTEASQPDSANNSVLRDLIGECSTSGGVFDVYFKRAGESIEMLESSEPDRAAGDSHDNSQQVLEEKPGVEAASPVGLQPVTGESAGEELSKGDLRPDGLPPSEMYNTLLNHQASSLSAPERAADEALNVKPQKRATGDLEDPRAAEAMVEVKRLMGEIARTIEEAAQAIEQRDIFPMYLRTGQLKIADRYPFLDPFGAEFEYLAGEIAFIGKASPGEFIAGLTEALNLAVISVVQSSTQPARMRARVTDDLQRLSSRLRSELKRFDLDQAIERILKL